MVLKTRLGLSIAFLFLLAFMLSCSPAATQSSPQNGRSYFPETGHSIQGEFLSAYWSVKDPLLVYGFPITDAYQDATYGKRFQYFQRARFELMPDQPPGKQVKISPLGEYLSQSAQPVPIPANLSPCRTFPQSKGNFRVCFSFLEFFDAHGGVEQFGLPFSNLELQDGRFVQYFERARFEWHPEMPVGQRVKLGDLGSQYFKFSGEDLERLHGDFAIQGVVELDVNAYVTDAATSMAQAQTVYVIVRDQKYLEPIAGATVALDVRLPSGSSAHYQAPPTNDKGVTSYTFQFASKTTGRAIIWVTASYNQQEKRTVTSFRLWY